jgi:hypothetical protein
MSFDLGVWHSQRALDAATAEKAYIAICEGEAPPAEAAITASPSIANFLAELSERFPDLDSLPEDAVGDSPWSSGFEHSDSCAIFNVQWPRAGELLETMRSLAAKHGLVLYDPQESEVHNPPHLAPRRPWQFWRR